MILDMQPHRLNIKGYKRSDCTVISLGNALGISYDLSRKVLQTATGMQGNLVFSKNTTKTKEFFTRRNNILGLLGALSEDFNVFIKTEELDEKMKANKKYKGKGDSSNSLAKFAEVNNEGVYMIVVYGHLVTVVDGIILDSWDSSERAVEVAFRIDVDNAREKIKDLAVYFNMDKKEHYRDVRQDVKITSKKTNENK